MCLQHRPRTLRGNGYRAMKLFGYFRSSTSYRLRIALNLKGLAFENVPVNLVTGENKGTRLHGPQPVRLVAHAGDRRARTGCSRWRCSNGWMKPILFLPLLPADIEARYTVRELAYAIATELHAVNNLPVAGEISERPAGGHTQDENQWHGYRHWLARTLVPARSAAGAIERGRFPP